MTDENRLEVDDKVVFIYDNAELTIYTDKYWTEPGTDNHSGWNSEYEGRPLDELRSTDIIE